jgi:hypothetical protein
LGVDKLAALAFLDRFIAGPDAPVVNVGSPSISAGAHAALGTMLWISAD